MKRILIPLVMVAAVFVILVLTYQNLQNEPASRDEPAAVILRAPGLPPPTGKNLYH